MAITGRSEEFIPLRGNPDTEDGYDQKRVEHVQRLWRSLDEPYLPFNRQVEENIRMLAGLQWSVYHPVLGKYIDATDLIGEEELKWRKLPVFNRLIPWFILTHARATESMPIVTFVPGPDKIDSELAEIMDVVFKSLWFEIGMTEVVDRLFSWVIAAGRGHTITRVNPDGGQLVPWVGTAPIPVFDTEQGMPVTDEENNPIEEEVDGVPFDAEGNPLAYLDAASGQVTPVGEPHQVRQGTLVVDVLSPLQVRGQWGPQPWHQKKWHIIRTYHTVEEAKTIWGVDLEPDLRAGGGMSSETGGRTGLGNIGEAERILFGTGFYGVASRGPVTTHTAPHTDGYVEVTQLWEAPNSNPGMEETHESPGGRWLVVTRKSVIRDGVRPARYPYTSPLRTFEFIRIPGRWHGTTPLEIMNPVQRSYNRGYAHLQEHVQLMTNPKIVVDAQSGIKRVTNAPAQIYTVNRRPGVPTLEYVRPPELSQDVYKLQGLFLKELTEMGNMQGSPGELPSLDASGELVKELRFDRDRFLGPPMRRAVEEFGRMIEDWMSVLPTIWKDETIISYAGEDNLAKTVTVLPQMFEIGNVHIRPDAESMLPEGRGERQERVYRMYTDGLFGQPGSPGAIQRFFELARFPHLSRAAKPGGIDRVSAERENGLLLQGADPLSIPVFEWYDDLVHLQIHEDFMKSPEFLKQSPEVREAFIFHRLAHLQNLAMKMPQQPTEPGAEGGGGPPGAAGNEGKAESESALPPGPASPQGPVPGGRNPTSLEPVK